MLTALEILAVSLTETKEKIVSQDFSKMSPMIRQQQIDARDFLERMINTCSKPEDRI